MIQTILLAETILVAIAMLAYMPSAIRYYKEWDGSRIRLFMAWSMMIIGQFTVFKGAGAVEDISEVGAGALYQLAWMSVGGLLTLLMLMNSRIPTSVWRFPLIALLLYVAAAFVSAGLSDSPLLSLYRTTQVAIDAALIVVGYTILRKTDDPRFLVNITIFWLVIFIFFTGLGGGLLPEKALVPNAGALGVILYGSILFSHPNSLGLLAAIAFFVAVLRSITAKDFGDSRFFWLSFLSLSGTVLFLAQARTSLAGCSLALFLAGLMLKKMRWLSYAAVLFGIALLSYYWLSDSTLGFESEFTKYVRRGASDESIRSLSGRTELWEYGWQLFKESPLLGHGFGLSVGTTMHSAHMGVLVNTGLVGYIFWLMFVFGVVVAVFRNLRYRASDPVEYQFAVGVFLIVIILLVRSILGFAILGHKLDLMIFLSIYLYATMRTNQLSDNAPEPARSDAASSENLPRGRRRVLSYRQDRN